MSAPLYTGTYYINGRNYRRTPYQMKIASEIPEYGGKSEKFEDTPDIYEDEPAVGCMAPRRNKESWKMINGEFQLVFLL